MNIIYFEKNVVFSSKARQQRSFQNVVEICWGPKMWGAVGQRITSLPLNPGLSMQLAMYNRRAPVTTTQIYMYVVKPCITGRVPPIWEPSSGSNLHSYMYAATRGRPDESGAKDYSCKARASSPAGDGSAGYLPTIHPMKEVTAGVPDRYGDHARLCEPELTSSGPSCDSNIQMRVLHLKLGLVYGRLGCSNFLQWCVTDLMLITYAIKSTYLPRDSRAWLDGALDSVNHSRQGRRAIQMSGGLLSPAHRISLDISLET